MGYFLIEDPEGNRIGKSDTNGTTSYVINPHGDALPRVLVRENPDLSAGQAGGSINRYVYGIGLLYEVDDNDNATYYHYDQIGSTIALTDANGAVMDRVEYSPFGTITHRTGTTDTPFLYAGHEARQRGDCAPQACPQGGLNRVPSGRNKPQFGIQQDPNGLLHMRARYYSPELRRFINADPIGFAGGLNWYAYAGGNPVMYVDPEGTNPLLLAPLIIYGTTQVANAPGPNDPTYAEPPNVEEALLLTAAGPAAALSRTAVNSAVAGGRSFMKTLTGPATSASVRNAGTMGFADATVATGTLARATATATSNAATSASRKLASKALVSYGAYSTGTFGIGTVSGILTPTDANSLPVSGNPFTTPFELGSLTGSFLGNAYEAFKPPK